MELAYITRQKPLMFRGKVEVGEASDTIGDGGPSLLVFTERRRLRVPLHDSFFADPIMDTFSDNFDGDARESVMACLTCDVSLTNHTIGRKFSTTL